MTDISIRRAEPSDGAVIRTMLILAIFVPEGEPPVSDQIADIPALVKYHHMWGRQGDIGVIAEKDGVAVGAAWLRFFCAEDPGYGYLRDGVSELSMAVVKEYRGIGVGAALLSELFSIFAGDVSLSVDRRNRAVNLYRRSGFTVVRESGSDFIMLRKGE